MNPFFDKMDLNDPEKITKIKSSYIEIKKFLLIFKSIRINPKIIVTNSFIVNVFVTYE